MHVCLQCVASIMIAVYVLSGIFSSTHVVHVHNNPLNLPTNLMMLSGITDWTKYIHV